METIKELVLLIERSKVRKIDVVGYGKGREISMLNEFYSGLVNEEIRDDHEAARLFFQSHPSEPSYRKFKTRFKKRLLNTIFFLNIKQSQFTESNRAYLNCLKEIYAAKILFNRGVVNAAGKLAHKALRQCILFEFTELSLDICKMLRTLYATRCPDSKKFSHYNKLTQVLTAQFEMETQAQGFYLFLASKFMNTRASSPKIAKQAMEFVRILDGYKQKKPSFYYQRYYQQIVTLTAMCCNDYRKALQLSKSALEWIETKPFNAPSVKTFFHFQIIACCTYLQEYDEGLKYSIANLEQETEGSLNWFKNRELSFTLAMHTRNYQEAYLTYLQVVRRPEFKKMDAYNTELWKIFEAYIMYLKAVGKVETEPQETGNNFRLHKFLNEVPIFTRDKQGLNIPILVLQVLFSVANRRYKIAHERIGDIEKYCSRYLRKNETYRSDIFIRMLLEIPLAGFNRFSVSRRVQLWKQKLHEMPLEIAYKGRHIEVIPYEDLWDIAVESLDTTTYQSGKAKQLNQIPTPAVNEPAPTRKSKAYKNPEL